MAAKRNYLLLNLLRVVVEEYGHEEVVRALARLPYTDRSDIPAFATGRPLWRDSARHHEGTKPKRPTAVDQALKLSAEAEEPDALLLLAAKFDRKEFLPSTADIREFLAMMGQNVEAMKDRVEGFRVLLPLLVKLPPARIRRLANGTNHSGPAQLGPLADAIRSAGETMRRGVQAPYSDKTPPRDDEHQRDTARQSTNNLDKASSLTTTGATERIPAKGDEVDSGKRTAGSSNDLAKTASTKISDTITS